MSNYNPFIEASKAAIATLTSDNAKAYYASRALEDIDRIVTVCEAVYAVASMVYNFGAFVGEVHYQVVSDAQSPANDTVKALPLPPAPIALLPEFSSAPKSVIITPAPKVAPIPTKEERLLKLSKKALQTACLRAGVQFKANDTKAALVHKLCDYKVNGVAIA